MNRLDNPKVRDHKQINCSLDEESYRTLQYLVQSHNLADMGEAIRLLVDFHQIALQTLQAIRSEEMDREE